MTRGMLRMTAKACPSSAEMDGESEFASDLQLRWTENLNLPLISATPRSLSAAPKIGPELGAERIDVPHMLWHTTCKPLHVVVREFRTVAGSQVFLAQVAVPSSG